MNPAESGCDLMKQQVINSLTLCLVCVCSHRSESWLDSLHLSLWWCWCCVKKQSLIFSACISYLSTFSSCRAVGCVRVTVDSLLSWARSSLNPLLLQMLLSQPAEFQTGAATSRRIAKTFYIRLFQFVKPQEFAALVANSSCRVIMNKCKAAFPPKSACLLHLLIIKCPAQDKS